jgi:hypothetical protein
VKRGKRRRRTVEEFTVRGPLAHALGPVTTLRAVRALEHVGLVTVTTARPHGREGARCAWCGTDPGAAVDEGTVCDLACAAALAVERDLPWPKEICRGSYSWQWVVERAGPKWSAMPHLRERWAAVQRRVVERGAT